MDLRRKKYGIWFSPLSILQKTRAQSYAFPGIVTMVKILAVAGLCALLARPTLAINNLQTQKNGIDIVIVLDISKSMLAQDILPTRLERAKTEIAKFIQNRPNDRIGIVLFAGRPFIGMPLTFDTQALMEFIQNVSTNSIAQNQYPELSGTAIGDGLLSGVDMLMHAQDGDGRQKAIMLFTDGEENVKHFATARQSAQLAKEHNIRIYGVGIGSNTGIALFTLNANGDRQYFLKQDGTPLIVKVDMSSLQNIAGMTGGKAYNASDTLTFTAIMHELWTLQKTPVQVSVQTLFIPYQTFLLLFSTIAVSLLFAFAGFIRLAQRKIPGGKNYEIRRMGKYAKRISAIWVVTCLLLTWFGPEVEALSQKEDIIFVLDASQSMDTFDVPNRQISLSRLWYAKVLIADYIQKHPLNRFWLVVFAGNAMRLAPLDGNNDFVVTVLSSVSSHTITTGGSNFIAGLWLSEKTIDPKKIKQSRIVLISDGGDTDEIPNENSINTLIKAPLQNIPIDSVGIGWNMQSPIQIGADMYGSPVFKMYNGQQIETKRNDTFLQEIAQKTQGTYTINPNSLDSVLEQNTIMNLLAILWTERYPYIFMTLVLLLITLYVPEKRKLEK